MSSDPDSEKATATWHCSEGNKERLEAIMMKLKKQRIGRVTQDQVLDEVLKVYHQKVDLKKEITTSDHILEEKYSCAFRFFHKEFYYCGKDAPKRIKLATLKQCEHCKNRMDEERFLIMQQQLTKDKIHAFSMHFREKLQDHEKFVECHPEEKQGEFGYEIKSDKCPNPRMKDQWHPPDLCDPSCPFLKWIKRKKLKKEQ